MKLVVVTALLASAVPIALSMVSASPGLHSTPGLWLMFAGLPGTVVAIWISEVTGEGIALYTAIALVNWAFYLLLIKGIVALKRRILNGRPSIR